jgi:hypothetical protein
VSGERGGVRVTEYSTPIVVEIPDWPYFNGAHLQPIGGGEYIATWDPSELNLGVLVCWDVHDAGEQGGTPVCEHVEASERSFTIPDTVPLGKQLSVTLTAYPEWNSDVVGGDPGQVWPLSAIRRETLADAVPTLPIDLCDDGSVTCELPPDHGGTGFNLSNLAGNAGKILAVNDDEDGYELVDDQTGGAGSIVDIDYVRNVSSYAFSVNTDWQDVNTALDLTLTAQAGDILEVGVSGQWSSGGQTAWLDVVTRVSGSPVNSVAENGAAPANGAGFGVDAWFGIAGATHPCSGSVLYTLVSGDISGGTVTIRLRGRLNAASSGKTFTTHQMWAKVIRP